MKTLVILKSAFSVEEAAVLKARNPSTKARKVTLCDKNAFNLIGFAGKQVVAADFDKEDKLTPYMLLKAIELGATEDVVAKASIAESKK